MRVIVRLPFFRALEQLQMQQVRYTCNRSVMKMKCKFCENKIVKNGRVKFSGKQRYYCRTCKKSYVLSYSSNAYYNTTNYDIVFLLKEGCGIRSISRILGISPTTVMKRIITIACKIKKPMIQTGQTHEMDEIITYIGNKEKRYCIAYAIDRTTRNVVDFNVGRRNNKTLRLVVNSLLLAESKQIRTDRLRNYIGLIPHEIHYVKQRGINRIERKNLTLRTHIKRLNRKTIAYTKSLMMLMAILKIYFWHEIILKN